MRFCRVWLCFMVVISLTQYAWTQDLDQAITVLKEKPVLNQYKGQMELFGNLYHAGIRLEENATAKKGIYNIRDYSVQLSHAPASVLLFSGIDLLPGEYLEMRSEKGFYERWNAKEASKKFNTGIIEGKQIEIKGFLLNSRKFAPVLEHYVLLHEAEIKSASGTRKDYGESNNCNINIECPLADPIRQEQRSTARILLIVEEGMGWCSGSLMNNTRNDGTPYLLTAFHCQDGFTPLFDYWRFDFNYQYDNCTGRIDEPQRQSLTGCSQISGRQESDFLLLELDSSLPLSYQAYFAGWNNSNNAPMTILLPHHPNGDVKKITSYGVLDFIRSNNTSVNWSNGVTTPANHHWFSSHDEGMFEPGSSGGPAYDQNNRVIGQLHGGQISCENGVSYFGKLSRSWEDGSSPSSRLRDWLSPDAPRTSHDGLDIDDKYCLGVTSMTQLNGIGGDGSGMDNYLPFTDCSYSILLPQDYIIKLTFDFILLDRSDTLKIYDGPIANGNLLDAFSGEYQGEVRLESPANELSLHFVSDGSSENDGFSFSYQGKLKKKIIGGSVKSVGGSNLEGVTINLFDAQFNKLNSSLSDVQGNYEFELDAQNSIYYLEAEWDEADISSGISLLDRLQLINFFRGNTALNDPFSRLAADIDRSKHIDRRDLIYLSLLQDGMIEYWPDQSTLWQFFNDDELPYSSEEVLDRILDDEHRMIQVNLSLDPESQWTKYNFTGLKTGDINLSR